MAVDTDVNYVKNNALRSLFNGQDVPSLNTVTLEANLAYKNDVDQELNAYIRNIDYVEFDPTTNVDDTYGDLAIAAKKLYKMIIDGEEMEYDKLSKSLKNRIKIRYKSPAFGSHDPME